MNRDDYLTQVAINLKKWPDTHAETVELYCDGFHFAGSEASGFWLECDTQKEGESEHDAYILKGEYLKRCQELANPVAKSGNPAASEASRSWGWYWIIHDDNAWECALWTGKKWLICNVEGEWTDNVIEHVGPRIPMPEKPKQFASAHEAENTEDAGQNA